MKVKIEADTLIELLDVQGRDLPPRVSRDISKAFHKLSDDFINVLRFARSRGIDVPKVLYIDDNRI